MKNFKDKFEDVLIYLFYPILYLIYFDQIQKLMKEEKINDVVSDEIKEQLNSINLRLCSEELKTKIRGAINVYKLKTGARKVDVSTYTTYSEIETGEGIPVRVDVQINIIE